MCQLKAATLGNFLRDWVDCMCVPDRMLRYQTPSGLCVCVCLIGCYDTRHRVDCMCVPDRMLRYQTLSGLCVCTWSDATIPDTEWIVCVCAWSDAIMPDTEWIVCVCLIGCYDARHWVDCMCACSGDKMPDWVTVCVPVQVIRCLTEWIVCVPVRVIRCLTEWLSVCLIGCYDTRHRVDCMCVPDRMLRYQTLSGLCVCALSDATMPDTEWIVCVPSRVLRCQTLSDYMCAWSGDKMPDWVTVCVPVQVIRCLTEWLYVCLFRW